MKHWAILEKELKIGLELQVKMTEVVKEEKAGLATIFVDEYIEEKSEVPDESVKEEDLDNMIIEDLQRKYWIDKIKLVKKIDDKVVKAQIEAEKALKELLHDIEEMKKNIDIQIAKLSRGAINT